MRRYYGSSHAQETQAETEAPSPWLLTGLSQKMKISDPLLNPLVPVNFFGGGAPKAPKPVKVPKVEPIEMPAAPAMPKIEMPKVATAAEIAAAMPKVEPAVPIPPPPTTSALEAQDQADEEIRKQANRRGMTSSIIAGEQERDYVSSATGTGSLLG